MGIFDFFDGQQDPNWGPQGIIDDRLAQAYQPPTLQGQVPAEYNQPATAWHPSIPSVEGPASFLSQIPQALLGRPSSGVVDFGKGALYGLATGDSGGMNQGLLGSLGRLGMMAMAVKNSGAGGKGGKFGDPMAALRVKDYFDKQDQEKRAALQDPRAADMTPEQFQGVYDFVPPTKQVLTGMNGLPIQPGAYTGGRVGGVTERIDTLPPIPGQQLKYQAITSRLQAAQAAPNEFEKRKILETGSGPMEETAAAGSLFDQFVKDNPIDEQSQYVKYSTNSDGSIVRSVAERPNYLMNSKEMQEGQDWLEANGLADKVARLPEIEGYTKSGSPLFSSKPVSLPQEKGAGDRNWGKNPVNDIFYAALPKLGWEKAAQLSRHLAESMGKDGKTKNDSTIKWYEEAYDVDLLPEEKVDIKALAARLDRLNEEDPYDKATREALGGPPAEDVIHQKMAEVVTKAKLRTMKQRAGAGLEGESMEDPNVARELAPEGIRRPYELQPPAPGASRRRQEYSGDFEGIPTGAPGKAGKGKRASVSIEGREGPMPEPTPDNLRAFASAEAERQGIPGEAPIILQILRAESGTNAKTPDSPKGAMGPMQLMPGTAARHGVDARDPYDNIRGGVAEYKRLLVHFKGNQELALAAYNAGQGAVEEHGGIPPYAETQGYVKKVMRGAGVRAEGKGGGEKEVVEKGKGEEDPFGPGQYDEKSAREAGIKPDPETGHMGSRVPSGPKEGLILKSPDHPTFWKALQADKEMGYHLYEKGDRYYSFKEDPGEGFDQVPDKLRDRMMENSRARSSEEEDSGEGEAQAAEIPQEEEKKPAPRTTPVPQQTTSAPVSRREIQVPRPRATPIKLKGRVGVVPDTASSLDSKISLESTTSAEIVAGRKLQEYADMLKNSDMNEAEAAKFLEDVVKGSRKLSRAEKEAAIRRIPKLVMSRDWAR